MTSLTELPLPTGVTKGDETVAHTFTHLRNQMGPTSTWHAHLHLLEWRVSVRPSVLGLYLNILSLIIWCWCSISLNAQPWHCNKVSHLVFFKVISHSRPTPANPQTVKQGGETGPHLVKLPSLGKQRISGCEAWKLVWFTVLGVLWKS